MSKERKQDEHGSHCEKDVAMTPNRQVMVDGLQRWPHAPGHCPESPDGQAGIKDNGFS
jgi:hypothetical protein